ncbi:MAG: DUF6797 domain-containing protein, partial [Planctomycetota bacterium]
MLGLTLTATLLIASQTPDEPWLAMDYGPFLSASVGIDRDDIAFKGVAVPLGGPDNESMLFDTDLLRWACGWPGGFVELRGIVYDGPHGIFPRIDGTPDWRNPPLPGVSIDGSFADPRALRYGPLPRELAAWQGVLRHGGDVAMAYRVGATSLLDAPSVISRDGLVIYRRTIEYMGGSEVLLQVVSREHDDAQYAATGLVWSVILRDSGRPVLGLARVHDRGDHGCTWVIGDDDRRVRLHPTARPRQVELLIAPLRDEVDAERFGTLLEQWPAPTTLDRFRRGGPAQWTEQPVLAGRLDVRFGRDDVSRRIVRAAGDAPRSVPLDLDSGDRAMLLTSEGPRPRGSSDAAQAVVIVELGAVDVPAPLAAWDFDEGEGERMLDRVAGRRNLMLDGVTWRRGVRGRSLDFDGTAHATWDGGDLDPLTTDFTFAGWIHTDTDGTIIARTAPGDAWVPFGWTFFLRDGAPAFDVGWVGVVESDRRVADASWHHVACTWRHEGGRVELFVDGQSVASGALPPAEPLEDAVVRLGFTAPDFPARTRFSGFMDGVRLFDRVLDAAQIRTIAAVSGEPIVEAWGLRGRVAGARWRVAAGEARLELPAARDDGVAELVRWSGMRSRAASMLATVGGAFARRAPFAVDAITWPAENAYASWMRFGAFDFLPGGTSAAITTWSGDVWRVDGLDRDLDALRWQRVATGLYQPLGLAVRGREILVRGRDQITRLDDLTGDGETDRYACFHHEMLNTEHFHEPCSGLQVAPTGELYYLKAARHAKVALHPQHGTLIAVSPDGAAARIIASGFRAPNGLWIDDDGTFWGSDQEGHWMPANRINAIVAGGFYGNNWSGTPGETRPTHDPPLCWVHPTVDRSPSAQVRVRSTAWGDLDGALLGFSYGTGSVYRILEDRVDGVRQGGVVPLPITVPTGLMMGRFNPTDGHLYMCGLFGWSSDATDPGGFYRVRATGPTPLMPVFCRATQDGLLVRFNHPLDPAVVLEPASFAVEAW